MQGDGFRKGSRKGDPNYEGKLEEIDPMIRDEVRGLLIPQGNVKAFPTGSVTVDIYKAPSGKPEQATGGAEQSRGRPGGLPGHPGVKRARQQGPARADRRETAQKRAQGVHAGLPQRRFGR